MSFSYTNRCGKKYSLYQGTTHTGKPRFYFSTRNQTQADKVSEIPSGYEVFERPENGQVFLRKASPQLILQTERNCVKQEIGKLKAPYNYLLHSYERFMTIYETQVNGYEDGGKNTDPYIRCLTHHQTMKSVMRSQFMPILRFELLNEDDRIFSTERFCFLGRIDDWMRVGEAGGIEAVARKYIPKLGNDEFFEIW